MPITLEEFIEKNGLSVRYKKTVLTSITVKGPEKAEKEEVLEWTVELRASERPEQITIHRDDAAPQFASDTSRFRNETQEEARQRLIDDIKGSELEIWQTENKRRYISVPDDLC